MKVRVVKARKSTYWYASHIGEEFEVLDNEIHIDNRRTKSYHLKDKPSFLIVIDDVDDKEKVIFT